MQRIPILIVAGVLSVSAAFPQEVVWRGLPLQEALERLRDAGLSLVYSTTLVKADLRVLEEPRATNPRAIVEEILAPHGLAVRQAGRGRLVVVSAARPPRPAPREDSAGDPKPTPAALPKLLDEIVVTPSHHRLSQEEPARRESLTREQIDRMPHLGDDAFWAVKRLPGTSGADVSARFNIRGGDADEMVVVLDGFELFEPFHLKDFMSIFSTLDATSIGTIDLLTGGFPAEYGDRLSGIMEITSVAPAAVPSVSASLGTINAHVRASGTMSEWSWLVGARAWYPDVMLGGFEGVAQEIQTDYSDIFGKLERPMGARSWLTIGALVSWDDLGLLDAELDETERIGAEYGSQHVWTSISTDWSPALHSRTVAGGGNLRRQRTVLKREVDAGELAILDERSFRFVSLEQDWDYRIGERHLLQGGLEFRRQEARYDYIAESSYEGETPLPGGNPSDRSFRVEASPRGESYGAYLSDRVRLGSNLIAEIGLRWDEQSWSEENQISPRVQMRYEIGPRTVARLAWGRYAQSQRLNELQVEDGVTTIFPAQLAEQWVGGVEQQFPGGAAMRIEGYRKDLSRVRPRWENLFNPLELFAEAMTDRVLVAPESARASGVEILVRGPDRPGWSWWGSYAWARAVDVIEGREVPRSWDQRHAISLGANVAIGPQWNVSVGGTWHTGWPSTAVVAHGDSGDSEIELLPGPRNASRLPDYARLDVRAARSVRTRRGTLTFIGEILNFTNRANVCCLDEADAEILPDGRATVTEAYRSWAPITPTFIVRWRP